jgi:ribosome-associated protein
LKRTHDDKKKKTAPTSARRRPTLKAAGAIAPRSASTLPESVPGTLPAPVRAGGKKRSARKAGPSKDDPARKVAVAIAEAGLEKKALHVEVIDVRGKVDYADYVVVMSGRSDRQVAALARNIEEEIERKEKVRCLGIEGLPQGSWVLMDFGDVVVHVFHEDTRGYYDLEALWVDAARVPVDDKN